MSLNFKGNTGRLHGQTSMRFQFRSDVNNPTNRIRAFQRDLFQ